MERKAPAGGTERKEERNQGRRVSKRNEGVVWGWEWRTAEGQNGEGDGAAWGDGDDENAQLVDQYTPPRRSSLAAAAAVVCATRSARLGSARLYARSLGHVALPSTLPPSAQPPRAFRGGRAIALATVNVLRDAGSPSALLSPPPPASLRPGVVIIKLFPTAHPLSNSATARCFWFNVFPSSFHE